MKAIFFDLVKRVLLASCFLFLISVVATCSSSTYATDLSKLTSVTPQRHCGFIVPNSCMGSQSMHVHGASITAMQTRLQSLYEGMTRQNKVLLNMSGGSSKPRVNPLTLISQISVTSQNSKLLGGTHHA